MEGQQFNVIEGRNGSITCTATGYPVPTVVWQNSDGSSLNNNRLVSGLVNMSSTGVGNEVSISVELMVIGAIREDDRMYRCSANNNIGDATTNIRIIIQCKCTVNLEIFMYKNIYVLIVHVYKFSWIPYKNTYFGMNF